MLEMLMMNEWLHLLTIYPLHIETPEYKLDAQCQNQQQQDYNTALIAKTRENKNGRVRSMSVSQQGNTKHGDGLGWNFQGQLINGVKTSKINVDSLVQGLGRVYKGAEVPR